MAATSTTTDSANGADVVGATQQAAEAVRSTAERAASHLPEVADTAKGAARDTQRRLEQMPNQALVLGTSFSLGLAAGLFIGGSNRLLVMLAAAPAAAMGLTMLARDEEAADVVGKSKRATTG
jgi:hypothetical protein